MIGVKSLKQETHNISCGFSFGGERGIRTPGGVTLNSFQDCRIRPLCHFSYAVANIHRLFDLRKVFLKNDMPIFTLWFIYGNYYPIWPSFFSRN